MDAKRPSPRHIIIKMPKVKDKERILKAAREKSYPQENSHKTVSCFLKRNFAARRDWTLRIKGQIKSFPDKKKLKEFIITKPYYMKC